MFQAALQFVGFLAYSDHQYLTVFVASLRSGCDAYGIEINHPVASLSFKQRTEFAARLRMWGLTAGKYEVLEGDFCESNDVAEWIRKADVVLVNNYIFGSDCMSFFSIC